MSGPRSGVVFGLVVAAGIAFLLLRGGLLGGGTPVPVADGPAPTSPAPVEPPRPQESSPKAAPPPVSRATPPEPPPTPPPVGAPLPATDVAIRLTLRGLDAVALGEAKAYVVGLDRQGRARVVTEAGTPSATVELVARAADVEGLSDLRVAVVAPGRPTGWSAPGAVGATGGDVALDMPQGVLLEGGVVDGKGVGVGGLPLVVTSGWGRTFAVYGEDLTFRGSVGRGTADRPLCFTRTTTDAVGRFALEVPAGTSVAVLADHEAWHLDVPEDGTPIPPAGRRGLVVRARPGFTLYAEILSANGGTAVEAPTFGFDRGREGLSFSDVFPTGDVRVTSPRQAPVDRKVTGTVRASARGFDPKTEKFLVEPGATSLRIPLRLEPRRGEAEAARIRIDLADASGRPVLPEGGQRPYLRVRRAEAVRWPAWVQDATLTRLDDTNLEGVVPEGEWNVQLVLPQHFVWVYATDATFTFAAGRETPWHAVLPDGGPLTIRWSRGNRPAPPAIVSLGIVPAAKVDDASAWSWEEHPGEGTEAVLARWPEGEWVVAVGARGAPEPRRTVTVKHGAPAVADFTR